MLNPTRDEYIFHPFGKNSPSSVRKNLSTKCVPTRGLEKKKKKKETDAREQIHTHTLAVNASTINAGHVCRVQANNLRTPRPSSHEVPRQKYQEITPINEIAYTRTTSLEPHRCCRSALCSGDSQKARYCPRLPMWHLLATHSSFNDDTTTTNGGSQA